LQFYVEKRDEKKGASKTSAIFYGDSKGSAKLLEDSQRIQLFDEQNTIDEIYASVANGPIDDALNHRKNINLLVVGASGSGKTFTMKGIVKKLGERVQTVVRHDHHTLVRAVVNNGKKEILNEIVDPDIEGHIYKIYTEGEELRSKKHSKAGHKSSREPLIFTLIIQKTQDLSMNRTFSHSIKLVDTCGNERIGSVDDDRTKGINSR
jgi:Cdc6-like AAA superfamily ATPase